MAQAKLWFRRAIFHALTMGLLATLLASCRADDKPVGITLLFQSAGRPVVVQRFDPDGRRGPVPGAVGSMSPRGGKEMAFMPGDSKRGMPTFVEVAWVVPTDDFDRWAEEEDQKPKGQLNKDELAQRRAEFKKRWTANPSHIKRIDLTPIITPELIEQVRADHQNTQLKLIITFNNEDVDIKAVAYKWRYIAVRRLGTPDFMLLVQNLLRQLEGISCRGLHA
jgi:hypothetical protein